jgi:DnaJ family protein A protein 5
LGHLPIVTKRFVVAKLPNVGETLRTFGIVSFSFLQHLLTFKSIPSIEYRRITNKMAAVTPRKVQCHYEVLGVVMDADGDVIKKAYRKAALEWHPDKNMHRIDEATERFRLISDAYQVLSDPKERAWYDTHRESILRGGDGTFKDGSDGDFVPNIWQYFSPPGKGVDFCEYFSKAFEEISDAERRDAQRQGKDDPGSLPLFGSKDSAFSEVKRFYSLWEGFNSKMSFSWMDKYDTREAENRFQRRHVEKLNDTERSAARRQYSENVRGLVEYCKKRDERWAMGMAKLDLEEKEKRERREKYEMDRKLAKQAKKLEIQRELEEERAREEAARQAAIATGNGEEGYEDPGTTNEDIEEQEHHTVWSCGICTKEFKSEKQLLNHEASKKHKDAVKAFLRKGGKLDEHQHPISQTSQATVNTKVETAPVTNGSQVPCPSCSTLIANNTDICPHCEMPVFLDEENSAAATPIEEDEQAAETVAENHEEEIFDDEEEDFMEFARLTEKRKTNNNETSDDIDNEQEDVAGSNNEESDDQELDVENDMKPTPSVAKGEKKIGKAKQKRLEKEKRSKAAAASGPEEIKCVVCGETFTSRTKLFKHVEDMDHAVPLTDVASPQQTSSANTSKKGKKKKN